MEYADSVSEYDKQKGFGYVHEKGVVVDRDVWKWYQDRSKRLREAASAEMEHPIDRKSTSSLGELQLQDIECEIEIPIFNPRTHNLNDPEPELAFEKCGVTISYKGATTSDQNTDPLLQQTREERMQMLREITSVIDRLNDIIPKLRDIDPDRQGISNPCNAIYFNYPIVTFVPQPVGQLSLSDLPLLDGRRPHHKAGLIGIGNWNGSYTVPDWRLVLVPRFTRGPYIPDHEALESINQRRGCRDDPTINRYTEREIEKTRLRREFILDQAKQLLHDKFHLGPVPANWEDPPSVAHEVALSDGSLPNLTDDSDSRNDQNQGKETDVEGSSDSDESESSHEDPPSVAHEVELSDGSPVPDLTDDSGSSENDEVQDEEMNVVGMSTSRSSDSDESESSDSGESVGSESSSVSEGLPDFANFLIYRNPRWDRAVFKVEDLKLMVKMDIDILLLGLEKLVFMEHESDYYYERGMLEERVGLWMKDVNALLEFDFEGGDVETLTYEMRFGENMFF